MIFEAKVFKNGNSQAIRLLKDYRIKSNKVYIKKTGNNLIMESDIWDKWWVNLRELILKDYKIFKIERRFLMYLLDTNNSQKKAKICF